LVREADHSPSFGTAVNECVELYLHSLNTPSWRGAQLKHRDNFTFISRLNWSPYLYVLLELSHPTASEKQCNEMMLQVKVTDTTWICFWICVS